MPENAPERPSFKEAFYFWLKLGFISFGGPAGQISIMHEFLVEKKRWISDSRFLHALNYCMLLPGPEAQQLATYTGWLLHGKKGGITAGVLFVLPSLFILLGLSLIYVVWGTLPWIAAMFNGLKPAVVAIVLLALFKMAKKSLSLPLHYIVSILAFVGIFIFKIHFPILIIFFLLIGFFLYRYFPGLIIPPEKKAESIKNEAGYFLNSSYRTSEMRASVKDLAVLFIIFLLLWFIPFFLMFYFSSEFGFWKILTVFFTKAAFVTFGGAYAVLPYVAQVSVEQLNWLSRDQMIDGLALGETTPGPLIMVLTFVGFMAGYNHFQGSLLAGAFGLATTAYYTFLPCFLFIFAGAPVIEKSQNISFLKPVLTVITAAVTGVILNLAVYFAEGVIFPGGLRLEGFEPAALIWTIISFVALYRYKFGMMPWIGISAIVGLVQYFLT